MALFPTQWRRDSDRDLLSVWGNMDSLLDRAWEGFFRNSLYPGEQNWLPPLDVAETEKAVVVKAELPGIDKKDLRVNLEDGTLSISGEKKDEKEEKGKYYRLERKYGSFTRRIALPAAVKADKVDARYEKGLLTVTLPKAEEESAKRKKIEIQ